ncbi:hypothetical protein E2C01_053501 [Portunus trituberculatus]|uniref:Uncharacterized protein n=1 Tax=Portunus trituberculatus TaxID=210409 RepID=A0A5B7GHA3_PORTR|nr:hypothetical protein [Portunus trituberculatus]
MRRQRLEVTQWCGVKCLCG